MAQLPPPPTYTNEWNVWINWFTIIADAINAGTVAGNLSHNNLLNIQGGASTERYHLLNTEHSWVQNGVGAKGATASISVTASPFTYQNTGTYDIDVIVSGGTVSDISFKRGSSTQSIGLTSGMFRLNNNDSLIVTYTVAPTMVSVPR
jgi:hypothetical protein